MTTWVNGHEVTGSASSIENDSAVPGTSVADALDNLNVGGPAVNRPAVPFTFQRYFDTDLGAPVWWDGANWVDSTGVPV